MYWYKSKFNVLLTATGFAMLFSTACKPDIKQTGTTLKYFDIKGYFTADTAWLNKHINTVTKTVMHNGVTESKSVKIDNWGQEVDLFTAADINKPAWKDSYTIVADSDVLMYKTNDPSLKMQEMVIKKENHKVKWILIYNKTKNILYQTIEKLTYYPDSLYVIEKRQRVRLLGTNTYSIRGEIKK